jgi:hypothetical protein
MKCWQFSTTLKKCVATLLLFEKKTLHSFLNIIIKICQIYLGIRFFLVLVRNVTELQKMKVNGNILLQYSHFSEIVFQIAGGKKEFGKKEKKTF